MPEILHILVLCSAPVSRLDGRAIKVLAALLFNLQQFLFSYQLRVIAPLEIKRRQRQNGVANDSQPERESKRKRERWRSCKAKMRSSGEIKALELS